MSRKRQKSAQNGHEWPKHPNGYIKEHHKRKGFETARTGTTHCGMSWRCTRTCFLHSNLQTSCSRCVQCRVQDLAVHASRFKSQGLDFRSLGCVRGLDSGFWVHGVGFTCSRVQAFVCGCLRPRCVAAPSMVTQALPFLSVLR